MIKRYNYPFFISIYLLLFSTILLAQPGNDECQDAFLIADVMDWCSDNEAYFTNGATPSGFGPPSCFNSITNDIWFQFTAIATDVTITVKGSTSVAPGGSLSNPEVVLYTGSCNGTINQQACENDALNVDIVELYKGGMVVGETYFIRIQGLNNNDGSFQLCVNNFNPPVNPGSDCIVSSVLCDKTSFVVQQVIGSGNDPNEAGNSSCLGGLGNSESNSTWFSWIAANDGTLTFTLGPLNISDDLDFVLYELPNGVGNCGNKQELRCMASGDFPQAYPSPCLGPTGLRDGETDNAEPAGCANPTQNSFLAPLQMTEGTAYALMINNFTGTGNGFSMEFGGTGEFQGPAAQIIATPLTGCMGEPISFQDNSSFPLGNLNSWEWNFGVGAIPSTASGPGPHSVIWNTPGVKSIAMTVGSDLGCQVTEIIQVVVQPCCNDLNIMTIDAQITDLLCPTIEDGIIDISVSSNAPPYTYEWSTGATTEDIFNLGLGDYFVTITNGATCDTVVSYSLTAPLAVNVTPNITKPHCMGGTDGAILLDANGGIPPYQYDWGSGFTNENSLINLSIGIYNVTVEDANNCQEILSIEVNELELVLDTNIPTVTPPSCFDSFDGSVQFEVANGTAPFLFDYHDGNGFVSTNIFTGLNSGTFNVTFQDAAGCMGDTLVELTPPPPLVLEINITNVSCFGAEDGVAIVQASGGVGNYAYFWNDPEKQIESTAVELDAGTYTVTVLDGNGCMIEDDVLITQPPELSVSVVNVDDVLCFGDSTGAVTVEGFGGNPPFSYSVDGLSFQSDTTLTNLMAGNTEIFILDQLGCMASTNVTISQPAQLVVDAGEDVTVELGFPADLRTFSFPLFRPVTYQWSPETWLSCLDCPNPEAVPPWTTNYVVTITDEDGCSARDSVTVFVLKQRPLYVPNAFSPNGDGINDYFTVFGGPAARQIQTMRVFNRWGALVFEGQNLPLNIESFGWNGMFKGEIMRPDVFAYYIVVDFIDNETVQLEGDITILE